MAHIVFNATEIMNVKVLIAQFASPKIISGLTAIVITFVGFYISHVVEDLRSGYTATYMFESDTKTKSVVFHLNNISRSKRIEAASFVIRCENQDSECFSTLEDSKPPVFVREVQTAPNFGRPIVPDSSGPAAIQVCLGAIAGARTSVRFLPSGGPDSNLLALYDPWSETCTSTDPEAQNLLLLHPKDIHAFLALNFFGILTYLLILTIGIPLFSFFVLSMCGVFRFVKRFVDKQDEDADDSSTT